MGFELNICSVPNAPPPKKPKPVAAPKPGVPAAEPAATELAAAAPAPRAAEEKVAPVEAAAPSEPRKAKSSKQPQSTGKRPRPAPSPAVVSAAPAAAAPVAAPQQADKPEAKLSRRYAHKAFAEVAPLVKEDPSKAAALPATLPLGGGDAFSAEKFEDLPIDQYLSRQLVERLSLNRLTPVQRHAIPVLLRGGDLLVRSPTGSGKTLAYAVPLVQAQIARGREMVTRAAGTFGVVLVPTRELCTQTHEVVERLTRPFPWLVTSTIMGGERRKAEKGRLRKGVALVIGTPGRVADHIETTHAWRLSSCAHLVLDEADRLLDLGFQEAIDKILVALAERRTAHTARRQTVCLSATLTKGLRALAGRSLTRYATLQLTKEGAQFDEGGDEAEAEPEAEGGDGAAPRGEASAVEGGDYAGGGGGGEQLDAPIALRQSFVAVPTKQRLTALLGLLRARVSEPGAECKVLVFYSSCDGVDFAFNLLAAAGGWPDLHEAQVAAGHADGPRHAGGGGGGGGGGEGGGGGYDGEGGDDDEYEDDGAGGVEVRRGGGDGGGGGGGGGDGGAPSSDGLSCEAALLNTTVLRLHGKMNPHDRKEAFGKFRRLNSGVMLATDVAARGLNLEGVHWIVQHDLPQDAKEYVHRIGRAARLGERGQAVLMLHPSEIPFLELLRAAGLQPREIKFASLQAALLPKGARRDMCAEIAVCIASRRGLLTTAGTFSPTGTCSSWRCRSSWRLRCWTPPFCTTRRRRRTSRTCAATRHTRKL